MEERENISIDDSKLKERALCEECKANPSKYKCPGCSIRSCSLPCVQAHKQRTGCNGKRDRTKFVPIAQFDDNILLSDYIFLEETKRIAESARRQRTKLCGNSFYRLPRHLFVLCRAASDRRTRLQFLPSGMTRRNKNQTQYDQRKKVITWTIEWQFHSTDVILVDHGIDENRCFSSVIEKHLVAGPWKHKLKSFCEEPVETLNLFICKNPKDPKSPFIELDMKSPIRRQLAEVVILEYPVIHVFLPSHDIPFVFIKAVNPICNESQDNGCEGENLGPAGVLFKEDEIVEQDVSLDPPTCYLTKQRHTSALPQMPYQNSGEKELDYSSNRVPLGGGSVNSQTHLCPRTREPLIPASMNFNVDQGNDAFVDHRSEYPYESGETEKGVCDIGKDFLLDEELEDGEIFE